ncbi:MAG: hypothetical protein QXU93_11640 [Thermoproteus sp.]
MSNFTVNEVERAAAEEMTVEAVARRLGINKNLAKAVLKERGLLKKVGIMYLTEQGYRKALDALLALLDEMASRSRTGSIYVTPNKVLRALKCTKIDSVRRKAVKHMLEELNEMGYLEDMGKGVYFYRKRGIKGDWSALCKALSYQGEGGNSTILRS